MKLNKPKDSNSAKVLTLANILSIIRALLAIPIIYTLNYSEMRVLTFILIMVAALTDALDGYFARRSNQVTHFGMWIDPIADFICVISISLFLVLMNRFPGEFFILFLFRHITIAIPAIYLINHSTFLLSANWYGKWGAGISALGVVLYIFPLSNVPWLPEATLWLASVLLIISWVIYIKEMSGEFKKIKTGS